MRKIKTQFTIIGNPVKHSLSPAMHNAAFKKLKLPYQYHKTKLTPSQLESFFSKLKNSDYAGLNITIPYKEAVIPFLDQLSAEAELIGAVNTIQAKDNKLIGYNTDGAGYLQSLLKEKKWKTKNKKIVLLGAGGAARGILVALCLGGAQEVIIVNRREEKTKRLLQEFKKKFPKVKMLAGSLQKLPHHFRNTDIFINTTSGGMKGNELPTLPLDALPRKAIVSDIVYKPRRTKLLKHAQKLKLKTHEGLGMLLYQGALAFEIWTGEKAPLQVMKKVLQKNL